MPSLLRVAGIEPPPGLPGINLLDPAATDRRYVIYKNSLVKEGEKMVLVIGENDWPFPIPLVKQGETWIFDTKAGRLEILNRRIGQNELTTIRTMREIADAEQEYAMVDRDGDGLVEYAGKFLSDPGKKNGLYWQTKEGEEASPLGELAAKAKAGGYTKGSSQKPEPYNGYYYLMLNKQGRNASGGAFDYVVKGKQIAGFAVVTYPAKYGNSGVMTFMVNQDGVVYQKDLGEDTLKVAPGLTEYNPDDTYASIHIEKHLPLKEQDVPKLLKIVIFRMLQEAMNNVAKHTKATRVDLHLRKVDDSVEFALQDNGAGFNLQKVLSRSGPGRGLGLASMRERAKLSGGSFTIDSLEGKGTTIRAAWPLIQKPAAS